MKRLSKLWKKRLYLPGARAIRARPGDPRIFRFNAQRSSILDDVSERVLGQYADSQQAQERALNDAAYHESRRLLSSKDDEERAMGHTWGSLHRTLARLSPEELELELSSAIRRFTSDVAGNFNPRVYRLASRAAPRLLTGIMSPSELPGAISNPDHALDDLLSTEGSMDQLKVLAGRGTLVFVPTHSSNLDSVVLAYALERHGLPPVVYGAGKNLFSNPVLSFFMHNLGAYRVDRRVKAQIYKDVLKTYSTVMLERGFHSLFFPGGTRSRSGAIESKLKLGLAGTALDAFARNRAHNIHEGLWFVPVTINYELVLEAETLAEDFLSEAGRSRYIIEDDEFSRVDRWIAFLRKIVDMHGACTIRFGTPLDPFGNPVDIEGESIGPQDQRIDAATYLYRDGRVTPSASSRRAYTQQLSEYLLDAYRQETVLTTTQLVAHALFRELVHLTPGSDLFARIRERGTQRVRVEDAAKRVGEMRDRLLGLEGKQSVHLAQTLEDTPPSELVLRALRAWNGYHARTAASVDAGDVLIQDPTLLYYYQNRLLPWADEIADTTYQRAAREIVANHRGLQ